MLGDDPLRVLVYCTLSSPACFVEMANKYKLQLNKPIIPMGTKS